MFRSKIFVRMLMVIGGLAALVGLSYVLSKSTVSSVSPNGQYTATFTYYHDFRSEKRATLTISDQNHVLFRDYFAGGSPFDYQIEKGTLIWSSDSTKLILVYERAFVGSHEWETYVNIPSCRKSKPGPWMPKVLLQYARQHPLTMRTRGLVETMEAQDILKEAFDGIGSYGGHWTADRIKDETTISQFIASNDLRPHSVESEVDPSTSLKDGTWYRRAYNSKYIFLEFQLRRFEVPKSMQLSVDNQLQADIAQGFGANSNHIIMVLRDGSKIIIPYLYKKSPSQETSMSGIDTPIYCVVVPINLIRTGGNSHKDLDIVWTIEAEKETAAKHLKSKNNRAVRIEFTLPADDIKLP